MSELKLPRRKFRLAKSRRREVVADHQGARTQGAVMSGRRSPSDFLPWPSSPALANRPIMCREHRIARPNCPDGDGDGLRQPFSAAIRAHGAFGKTKQCAGFRGAQIEIRFERNEVGPADWALLIRHNLQRIGAVIEAIFPFDAGAESHDPYFPEGGGPVEEDPKVLRPVNETSKIDTIFRSVHPTHVDCPRRAAGGHGLHARQYVNLLLLQH